MHPFREFRGKNVDEAILLACQAFGVEREELEIDIVSMGSPGFFGIGAKKAVVLARRRPPVALDPILEEPDAEDEHPGDEATAAAGPADEEPDADEEETAPGPAPLTPEALERLTGLVRRLLVPLVAPICGREPEITVRQDPDGVIVRIEDDIHQGLLIGREGQTILALQYVLNRMLTKAWREAPRVQLDAGDFRARQIARLQALAQSLAARAKRSGRIQSTGPLSSFHRRMVHLALRDDAEVRTVSKGSGALKRVLVCPVKGRRRSS